MVKTLLRFLEVMSIFHWGKDNLLSCLCYTLCDSKRKKKLPDLMPGNWSVMMSFICTSGMKS